MLTRMNLSMYAREIRVHGTTFVDEETPPSVNYGEYEHSEELEKLEDVGFSPHLALTARP
jgi:hypothetical protein